jgi:hypothetical protein
VADLSQLPQLNVERIGRMSGMAMRSVIALMDEQPDTYAALVERIGTWDDDRQGEAGRRRMVEPSGPGVTSRVAVSGRRPPERWRAPGATAHPR